MYFVDLEKAFDRVPRSVGIDNAEEMNTRSEGCEAAMTARIKCGWIKLRECSELVYGKRLLLKLKGLFT